MENILFMVYCCVICHCFTWKHYFLFIYILFCLLIYFIEFSLQMCNRRGNYCFRSIAEQF